ncbi:hypothetical protein [Moritella sp. F3]|uniref:hypothetical protein n=1 Tax=Moritella sp. F3 TaxID=2718882 RepID=UPI0018E16B3B|nr:hypothetical protein [Moritella sp. F3]GIC77667.1 hypothetical protein FMO001_23940 [Moritella sp. F1]GIC82080.1 hypothetical protein FMO003_23610 [Moritella sp. F3]
MLNENFNDRRNQWQKDYVFLIEHNLPEAAIIPMPRTMGKTQQVSLRLEVERIQNDKITKS